MYIGIIYFLIKKINCLKGVVWGFFFYYFVGFGWGGGFYILFELVFYVDLKSDVFCFNLF